MLRPRDLIPFLGKAEDSEKAKKLERSLQGLRAERDPVFLTRKDLDPILRWKLRGQYGRQARHLATNSEEMIETVSRLALNVTCTDWKDEAALRVSILSVLHGVGVPVASAILALAEPAKYAVIDFRGWRQIFGRKKNSFSTVDYVTYLHEVRRLAAVLKRPVREVDETIWERDRARRP